MEFGGVFNVLCFSFFFSFPSSRNLHIPEFLPLLTCLTLDGAVSPFMLLGWGGYLNLNFPCVLCIACISYSWFSLISGSYIPSASGPFSALTPSIWPQEILAKHTQVQQ